MSDVRFGAALDLALRAGAMTAAILATYVVALAVLVGLGLGVRRAFGLRRVTPLDVLEAVWLGFALALAFLLAWNFARPVDGLAQALLVAGGAAGWWAVRGELDLRLAGERGERRAAALAIAFPGLWLANHGIGANASWDCLLYNLQGVAWAHAAPAVPGIGNLYGPLGHVHASFLYAAALEFGPWAGRVSHVANGPLLWALAAQGIVAANAGLRSAAPAVSAAARYAAVGTIAALAWALTTAPSSVEPEVALTGLVFVAGGEIYRLAWGEAGRARWHAFRAFSFLGAAVVTKASAAAFAAVGGLLVAALVVRASERPLRALSAAAAPAVGLAGLWVARSVVLTGYPFFPLTWLPFPVDWRVPPEHPAAALAHIQFTAHGNAWEIGRVWWAWFWEDPELVFAPIALAALALLWLALQRRERPRLRAADLGLLAPALALAFWWASGPFIEYGAGFAWTLAGVAVAQAAHALPARRFAAGAAAALALLAIAQPAFVDSRRHRPEGALRAIARAHVALPPAHGWLHPPVEAAAPDVFVTDTGLALRSPPRFCADSPLPCTPHPSANLALRRPGDLAGGFRVTDGTWRMQRWPTPGRAPWFLDEWHGRQREAARETR